MAKSKEVIRTTVLDDSIELSLSELSQALNISGEFVLSLVDEGIIEPEGGEASTWRFRSVCVARARCAVRLSQDLGVNLSGAALALDLLDEIHQLKSRLNRFERNFY